MGKGNIVVDLKKTCVSLKIEQIIHVHFPAPKVKVYFDLPPFSIKMRIFHILIISQKYEKKGGDQTDICRIFDNIADIG